MKHVEGDFKGIDGLKIYYQGWLPEGNIKAIVQIAHGFAEHSGRYINVVNELVPLGYAIYANDHRGHGKSEGTTNYVKSMDDFVEDLKIFHDIIREKHPNVPIFLLGHSMGSGIAVNFAYKYQDLLKGLILSGVGTSVGEDLSGFLKFMSKVLSKIAPKMKIDPKLDPNTLSHDPEVVKAYVEDPLVHHEVITTRLGYILLKTFKDLGSKLEKIQIPTLVQRGKEDKAMQGFDVLLPYFKMKDKEIHEYDGLFHEVYNEIEEKRKMVLKDLSNWLEKHT